MVLYSTDNPHISYHDFTNRDLKYARLISGTPSIDPITESQGHYYNTAPVLSHLGFNDDEALDDGWCQMDSYTGTWAALFENVDGTSWDSDNWTIPGFDALAEGTHTIYFKASDATGIVEGESGEWSWQFYKDTTPPADINLSHGCGNE